MLSSLRSVDLMERRIDSWLRALRPRAATAGIDPIQFARRHGIEPDPWQAEVLTSQRGRILLCWARQTGKSTVTALLAAYEAITRPQRMILVISPSQRQSGELYLKIRQYLVDQELVEDTKTSCMLDNGSRIISLPSSERTIRGYSRVDLIIGDEAARIPDELYFAVKPMLATSGGRIILISTPFGKRGYFYEVWAHGGGNWMRSRVTAEQNPRIPPEFLDEERRNERNYRQEYLCEFLDVVDSVFADEDILAAFDGDVRLLFGDPAVAGEDIVDDRVKPLRW